MATTLTIACALSACGTDGGARESQLPPSTPLTTALAPVTTAPGHRQIQIGYLIGVLTYLRHRGRPDDWQVVLRGLHFDETDWDFQPWVETLSGAAGTDVRRIAWSAFAKMFGENAAPAGSPNLADYFQGNSATVTLQASFLTPAGRPQVPQRLAISLPRGQTTSSDVGGRKHLKLSGFTENIGHVDIVESPFGYRFSTATLRRGVLIGDDQTPNPFRMKLRLWHYGGTASESQITVKMS